MASTKGKFLRFLSGMILNKAHVTDAQDVGGFRLLTLRSALASFSAGSKIQVLLPSDDARTYTPIPSPGGFSLLGWKQAGGPGAQWLSTVGTGDEILFVGPQRSLDLAAGPVVIVGDETSMAVAAALAVERAEPVHAVLQSEVEREVRAAASSVGLRSLDVVRRGDTAATVTKVTARLAEHPSAVVGLTGCADIVVAARDALKRAGVRNVKAKPYWIAGKAGLD